MAGRFYLTMSKFLRTSDLARAVGIHPNTVRLYVDWGLLPPVERSPSGYRLFTKRHLDCLRLARMIYAAQYPGRDLRASSNEITQRALADNWSGALEIAHEHLLSVNAELEHANQAAKLLEHWAQTMNGDSYSYAGPLAIGEVSKLLGVSLDVIRIGSATDLSACGATRMTIAASLEKGDRTPAGYPYVEPCGLQSHGDIMYVH